MRFPATTLDRFTFGVGLLLAAEGVWGLFSPVVFGVLSTNLNHALIHLVLAALGLWASFNHHARGFCLFLGWLLLAVGILRFVPGVGGLIVGLLNVNPAVAMVNIVVGLVALSLVSAQSHQLSRRAHQH